MLLYSNPGRKVRKILLYFFAGFRRLMRGCSTRGGTGRACYGLKPPPTQSRVLPVHKLRTGYGRNSLLPSSRAPVLQLNNVSYLSRTPTRGAEMLWDIYVPKDTRNVR